METAPQWITFLGVAVPLIGLAGSAIAYVANLFRDARVRRRTDFLELMQLIDIQGSIAKKVTAVYQLRQFPEHAGFIIRFCKTQRQSISGEGVALQSLVAEMDSTREFF